MTIALLFKGIALGIFLYFILIVIACFLAGGTK